MSEEERRITRYLPIYQKRGKREILVGWTPRSTQGNRHHGHGRRQGHKKRGE